MKKLVFTLALLLTPALAYAQGGGGYSSPGVRIVASLPVTCSVGQVVFNTGSPVGLHQCTATDTWEQLATGAGSGDINAIGDCTTGDCFNGSAGTTLTFEDAGGDATLIYDATADAWTFLAGKAVKLGAAGVSLAADGDGAITFLGLGNGSDEDLTINLDDTADTIVFSSSTGVTLWSLGAMNIAIGTDPGDAGPLRLANNALIAWEAATPGTDLTLGYNGSDVLVASGAMTVTGAFAASSTVDIVATGVRLSAADGVLTLLGLGNGNDENLTLDFDNGSANTVVVASGTGVSGISFTSIGLTAPSGIFTSFLDLPVVTAFPGSPAEGYVVIVSDDSAVGACDSAAGSAVSLCYYTGAAWASLGDGGGGGSGDVTAVGDCTTGACFDGTSGTTLTFNNAGGDGTLIYDGTTFTFSKAVDAPNLAGFTDPDADAIVWWDDSADGMLGLTTSGLVTFMTTPSMANLGSLLTDEGTGVITALGVNVGSAGAFVVNGGALGTPSSGTLTLPFKMIFTTAVCQNATASGGGSLPTTLGAAAICVSEAAAGGDPAFAGVTFVTGGANTEWHNHFPLPSDWTGNIDVLVKWWANSATGNDVVFTIQVGCTAAGQEPQAITFDSSTFTASTNAGTNLINHAVKTGVTVSTCAAGEELFFILARDTDTSGDTLDVDVNALTVEFTYRRAVVIGG